MKYILNGKLMNSTLLTVVLFDTFMLKQIQNDLDK